MRNAQESGKVVAFFPQPITAPLMSVKQHDDLNYLAAGHFHSLYRSQ